MKILKKLLLAALIFSVSIPSFSYGFNDAVEDSRTRKNEPDRRKSSDSGDTSACAETMVDVCCSLCSSDIFTAWLALLALARYRDYPYAGGGNDYIWYMLSEFDDHSSRAVRFSLSDSPFLMDGSVSWGNDMKFEGLFWFVGPYIEHMHFMNKDEGDEKSLYNGNIRLGGQMMLFQHNIFSLAFIAQWSHWYGDANEILDSGISVGFEAQSFPVRPLHLDWKMEFQSFNDNVNIIDSVVSAGLLLNRYEFFAGWKYLGVRNSATGVMLDSWNGITAGVKFYF